MLPSISLCGRSGSGKTLIANYLADRYNYHVCRTGAINREICSRLFGDESKAILNRVTDALRAIDPLVYIRTTLRESPLGQPLVFDSIRYRSDYEFAKKNGFICWLIHCPLEICVTRLNRRGQSFIVGKDDQHLSETELLECKHDLIIDSEEES